MSAGRINTGRDWSWHNTELKGNPASVPQLLSFSITMKFYLQTRYVQNCGVIFDRIVSMSYLPSRRSFGESLYVLIGDSSTESD